jgi:hypothetical protein
VPDIGTAASQLEFILQDIPMPTRSASSSFPLPSKLIGGVTNHVGGIMGSCSFFWNPRIEYKSRDVLSFFSLTQVGQGALGR